MAVHRHIQIVKSKKGRHSSSQGNPISELRDITCHMGSHSVTCHPTKVNVPNNSHAGWYSTYLPWRDGRLSWSRWLDSTTAGSRTSDLFSITSPTLNCCTTKTPIFIFSLWCQFGPMVMSLGASTRDVQLAKVTSVRLCKNVVFG